MLKSKKYINLRTLFNKYRCYYIYIYKYISLSFSVCNRVYFELLFKGDIT